LLSPVSYVSSLSSAVKRLFGLRVSQHFRSAPPHQTAPFVCRWFLLSLAWLKQLSLYPVELDSQAVFAKNWRELDPSVAFAMRHFIFRWLATTVAVMVAASVIHGIRYDSAGSLIGAALLLGILNAFVRPVLLILSAPLILLTLGLFILVVNGLLLWFVPNIVPGFHVDNFGSAFWGAIVIGLVSWMLSAFFRGSDGRVHVLTHHTQIKRVQGRVIEPGDRS
jgi:putative membrane protein